MNNYYLGYEEGTLRKIQIPNVNAEIASVVTFTLNFNDQAALKDYLYSLKLIPRKNVRLKYLIEKKRNGQTYIEELKTEGRIYTRETIEYFNSIKIFNLLKENKYDIELITYLYGSYLKKLGVFNNIREIIVTASKNPRSFKNFLDLMIEIPYDKPVKDNIQKLINYIEHNEKINQPLYQEMISNLLSEIEFSNPAVVNSYVFLRRKCESNIPTIKYLDNAFTIIVRANNMGIENFEYSQEFYEDPIPYLLNFAKSQIYTYDKATRGYKMENGKPKIRKRELFDLGVILEGFEKYMCDYYSREFEPTTVSRIDSNTTYEDSDDEFLEEDDFERLNTTSEAEGFKLKK